MADQTLFINEAPTLGDQLCSWRVISEYAQSHRNSRVVVAQDTYIDLFRAAPWVDRIISTREAPSRRRFFDGWRRGWSNVIRFDLQHGNFYRQAWAQGLHLIEAYAAQVPIEGSRNEPFVSYIPDAWAAHASDFAPRPTVVVTPHSPTDKARQDQTKPPNKEWPLKRWGELAERIVRTFGATVVACGAAHEKPEPCPSWKSLYGEDLRMVAELLRSASAVVAVDNGLAHLARAVGAPVLIQIAGNHCPPSWYHYPETHLIHRWAPITDITLDEVWEVAAPILEQAVASG